MLFPSPTTETLTLRFNPSELPVVQTDECASEPTLERRRGRH